MRGRARDRRIEPLDVSRHVSAVDRRGRRCRQERSLPTAGGRRGVVLVVWCSILCRGPASMRTRWSGVGVATTVGLVVSAPMPLEEYVDGLARQPVDKRHSGDAGAAAPPASGGSAPRENEHAEQQAAPDRTGKRAPDRRGGRPSGGGAAREEERRHDEQDPGRPRHPPSGGQQLRGVARWRWTRRSIVSLKTQLRDLPKVPGNGEDDRRHGVQQRSELRCSPGRAVAAHRLEGAPTPGHGRFRPEGDSDERSRAYGQGKMRTAWSSANVTAALCGRSTRSPGRRRRRPLVSMTGRRTSTRVGR